VEKEPFGRQARHIIMLYVYCEGYTEESFTNNVLAPYMLNAAGLYLKPIVCVTKRTLSKKHKGGISSYSKVRNDIRRFCAEHRREHVTSMLDFYALPDETPGMDSISAFRDVYKRVEHVESEIYKDIGCENFIPNLMLHEFESIIFVNLEPLSQLYPQYAREIENLKTQREEFDTPEHIDLGRDTAPSKRILSAIWEYDKVIGGTITSLDIGMENIIKECRHFSEWIEKLRQLDK
jgi:hypothetical protein